MKLTMTYNEHAQLCAYYLNSHFDDPKRAMLTFLAITNASDVDQAKRICVDSRLPEWLGSSAFLLTADCKEPCLPNQTTDDRLNTLIEFTVPTHKERRFICGNFMKGLFDAERNTQVLSNLLHPDATTVHRAAIYAALSGLTPPWFVPFLMSVIEEELSQRKQVTANP